MDPKTLIDTSLAVGLPAPIWFIELFKWLGFTLHTVPMNLWYAGLPLAMLLTLGRGEQGRRLAARLMAQMPILLALGINFGIVPLLFIQVGFAQVFYPATILMAWFWLGVIVLLVPAYYGVYVYALGLAGGRAMSGWRRLSGWASAALLLAVGFIFANAMSTIENGKGWPAMWLEHSFHGATYGTALNVADPRLWPRWLLMFGLALTTTAAWMAIDSAWLARREPPEYRAWAKRFSWKLYTFGAAWFLAAGAWYSLVTWPPATKEVMFHGPWLLLTVAAAAAPAAAWLLLTLAQPRKAPIGRSLAALVGLAQFGALGINAAGRQWVQHLEIRPYFDILSQPTEVQWSPLVVFLLAFVAGLGLVGWMLYQVAKVAGQPEAA